MVHCLDQHHTFTLRFRLPLSTRSLSHVWMSQWSVSPHHLPCWTSQASNCVLISPLAGQKGMDGGSIHDFMIDHELLNQV